MPNCKNCGKYFPNKISIEGKIRTLHSRKFCLECSPFGKHNTRRINELPISEETSRFCRICGKEYAYNRKNGHRGTICNSCTSLIRRKKVKQKSLDYKGGKCQVCGYNKCNQALEFHHLDPSKKEMSISGSHCQAWNKIKKELDKCILVCANCHRELENGLIKL